MLADNFDYHLENLEALDPDQLVSDLKLTTGDLIGAFPNKVIEFINREFG